MGSNETRADVRAAQAFQLWALSSRLLPATPQALAPRSFPGASAWLLATAPTLHCFPCLSFSLDTLWPKCLFSEVQM